jgi:hypothetical protein
VRTARGAKKRQDGEDKSADTGSRQVPRFGFYEPSNPALLSRLSSVFAPVALQNLFLPLFDFAFLLDRRSRGGCIGIRIGKELVRGLDGKQRNSEQKCDPEKFPHGMPPSRLVTKGRCAVVYPNLSPGMVANLSPE